MNNSVKNRKSNSSYTDTNTNTDRNRNGLFKLMTSLIDKYGVVAIDWTGQLLGLNKNGKPVTKQTAEELSENLNLLAEKLKDPKVMNSLTEIIKESEPILQEVIFSMLKLILSTGRFIVKDVVTFLCLDTPLAPVCSLFKFADNTIVFADELLNTATSSLETIMESQKVGKKIINNLNDNIINNKDYLDNNYKYNGYDYKKNKSNITKSNITNPNITMNMNTNMIPNVQKPKPKSKQKGGVKNIYKEKKDTENRINNSLHEFMNLKLKPINKKIYNNKTRRIKKK